MKFTPLTILLLSGFTMNAVRGQNTGTNGSPVQIDVSCHGIDADKLDVLSSVVFGQVLEESYAKSLDLQFTDSFLTVSENENWPYSSCGSLCRNNDDTYKRNVRRPPTGNKANEINFEDIVPIGGDDEMNFEGFFTCGSLCDDGKSDDEMLLSLTHKENGNIRGKSNDSSFDMGEWEKNLVRSLIDTRRRDFRAVEDCKIMMKAGVLDANSE
jgi:hypothetical protein